MRLRRDLREFAKVGGSLMGMSGVYLTMSWLSPDRHIGTPELLLVGSVVLVGAVALVYILLSRLIEQTVP
ncbi:MAG: hypothetical protein ABEI31_07355 [Halodesulfurarchaeum sp.]